jgi:hypothetical protein
LACEDNAIGHWFDTLESVRGEGIKMKQTEEKTVCALCGYTASGRFVGDICLARIFHELLSRDHEDGRATWLPQGVGSEAYLNGTSQGPTPEDARKDGHIIRARCAPLSPASGFPVSWSQQVIHEISGLGCGLTYWKCGNCDFLDVSSYIPDFGGVDNIDPRLWRWPLVYQ